MLFLNISSKIKKIFISLIFIFTFATLPVSGLLSEDLAIQGNYFEKNGEYEKALECYSQAAANSEDKIYKYDQMKLNLEYQLGRYKDAEKTQKIINKKTSGNENCYKGLEFYGTFARGISLINSYDLDEAIKEFKKALDYCPFDTDTQILIGYLRAKKEGNDVALKYLENQNLISGILWKQKGDLLRDMLRIEEAKKAYQEALKRDPELDEAKKELNKLNKDLDESSKNQQTQSQEEKILPINKERPTFNNPSFSQSISNYIDKLTPSSIQQKPDNISQRENYELKEISFRETFDEISVPAEAVEWNQKGVKAYNQENINYAIECFDKA
ncbi:tetratricopeptide repeat protein, partial [Methanospirillum sp.]|uniref:tetratricopeptide repeat protein n=1 Tax=Methanospirillum sp. TaxID=45200 RepID=UPI002C1DF0B8